jgi:outer membrane lipoprotein-sorting protein
MNIKLKFLCFVALFVPVTSRAQTADEIVNKVLAARGGMAKIKAVHSERITGNIDFGGGNRGPFIVELERPGKMHIEVIVQGQKLIRSYDGKSGWILNPFAENPGVQPMSEDELGNISDESDFDGPLVDYQQKGNKIELADKEDINGKPAYRLKFTSQKGATRSYIFDAESFHLLRWEGTRKVGPNEMPWDSQFFDYRQVNGLLFAFEIDSDAPGTEQTQKIIADKIEIDPQIDESHFGKPSVTSATPAQGPPPPPASNPPAPDK